MDDDDGSVNDEYADPSRIREGFRNLLETLTSSKEPIHRATKFLLDHSDHCTDWYSILLAFIPKVPVRRRLPFFYLVDSICQSSKLRGQADFVEAVSSRLNTLVSHVCPRGYMGDDTRQGVLKVLRIWISRRVFNPDVVLQAAAEQGIDEADIFADVHGVPNGYNDKRGRSEDDWVSPLPNNSRRPFRDVESVVQILEEDRQEHKRHRWESALRPESERPGSEFDDWWGKASSSENRNREYTPTEEGTSIKNTPSSVTNDGSDMKRRSEDSAVPATNPAASVPMTSASPPSGAPTSTMPITPWPFPGAQPTLPGQQSTLPPGFPSLAFPSALDPFGLAAQQMAAMASFGMTTANPMMAGLMNPAMMGMMGGIPGLINPLMPQAFPGMSFDASLSSNPFVANAMQALSSGNPAAMALASQQLGQFMASQSIPSVAPPVSATGAIAPVVPNPLASPFVTPALTPGLASGPTPSVTTIPSLTPGLSSTPTLAPSPGLNLTPGSTPAPALTVTSSSSTPTPSFNNQYSSNKDLTSKSSVPNRDHGNSAAGRDSQAQPYYANRDPSNSRRSPPPRDTTRSPTSICSPTASRDLALSPLHRSASSSSSAASFPTGKKNITMQDAREAAQVAAALITKRLAAVSSSITSPSSQQTVKPVSLAPSTASSVATSPSKATSQPPSRSTPDSHPLPHQPSTPQPSSLQIPPSITPPAPVAPQHSDSASSAPLQPPSSPSAPAYERFSQSPPRPTNSPPRKELTPPITRPPPQHSGYGRRLPMGPLPSTSVVVIWDLDETLICFNSLLNGSYVRDFPQEVKDRASNLSSRMEQILFNLLDSKMFFREIEDYDQKHIEDRAKFDDGRDLSSYDFKSDGFRPALHGVQIQPGTLGELQEKQLAFRFRAIRKLYEAGNLYSKASLLSDKMREELEQVYRDTDVFTDSWLSSARLGLTSLTDLPCVNVLVSNGQLIATLAKCLVYKLNDFFPADSIYSSRYHGKLIVFDEIRQRFGNEVRYVAVGDSDEEERAALSLQIPFYRVSGRSTLEAVYSELRNCCAPEELSAPGT